VNWDKEKQEQINIIQRNYYKYKEIKKIIKVQRTEKIYGLQNQK